MYAEERADIHDFLAALSSEQWAVPSLCAGWEVKDVAVHLLVDEPLRQLGAPRVLIMAAQCRFSVHRMNQWWVEHNRGVPTDSILACFAGPWRPGRISDRLGPGVGIRATVIHHQDMRRPLGMPRVIPEERLRTALEVVLTPRGSTNLGSFQRGEGIALRATDMDWSWGHGPEVSGPAESILMALAGRPVAIADLEGEGMAALTSRVEAPPPAAAPTVIKPTTNGAP
jgi:uncharacterized protein (TIGR03083 family)